MPRKSKKNYILEVSVALGIQYPKRQRHIYIVILASLASPYFWALSQK
jgi:hypothetical protein